MTDELDASQALFGMRASSFSTREANRNDDAPPQRVAEGGGDELLGGDLSVAVDRDGARAQFHEAMGGIADDDKAAYAEAARRAPNLVEAESNPDRYLEYDKYDPWKAARRVANYWKTRVEIFGDRAFLPLTLTGDGTMSAEDVKLLRTGFFMVLPNDKQGRAVVRGRTGLRVR
jgi:hypothetical protein